MRIGVAQPRHKPGDVEFNRLQMLEAANLAQENGCELLIFPRRALTGRTGPAMADTMAPAPPEDITRLGLGHDHTDRAQRPSDIGGSPGPSTAQGSGQANPDQDGRQ